MFTPALALALLIQAPPPDAAAFNRTQDVIYGRKFGTALTMDVFQPKTNPNGFGLVFVVSGGWFSAREVIAPAFVTPFIKRGYTVFAVVHGSQPKFTIPEILEDIHRAVRYIRYHAQDYHIDPDHIGIYGGSAGGHLSLMQGTAPKDGDPQAPDPVNRVSSRVQAVACFYPPTDFFNYGKPGEDALGRGILAGFQAPFDFRDYDPKTNIFRTVTDESRRQEIGRAIAPVYQVSTDDAPALIVHGDADQLVPIQQARLMVDALEKHGIPAKLIVKPGLQHGWPGLEKDLESFADWFDQYLRGIKPAANPAPGS
jgi:acetyl esterase/lipase